MALGMLLVIVGGNIDLSVGSIVGFVGARRGDADGRLSLPMLDIDVKIRGSASSVAGARRR